MNGKYVNPLHATDGIISVCLCQKAQIFHMKLCFVFQLFHGNWEGATVVKNAILSPFEARFVRFILNECSEDDCLLEAEAYLLIKGSQGFMIISL